ncbi:HNH nuclease [Methylophilaceae bacterium]
MMRLLLIITLLFSFTVVAKEQRSYKAKVEFKQQHPCPANASTKGRCEGYIIDHIIPLACGGADSPENMQWQTEEESKAKDKWERKGCN